MRQSLWLRKLKNKMAKPSGKKEDKAGPPKEIKTEERLIKEDPLKDLKSRYGDVDPEKIWVFSSGHDGQAFRGNPKYLFVYMNRQLPDFRVWWLCKNPDTIRMIKKLGYDVFSPDTIEAQYLINRTGVMVAEQVKSVIPEGLARVKYVNLWHGVGFKRIERRRFSSDIGLSLAKKYIENGTFFRDCQLVTVTSPMIEKEFVADMGVDSDQLIRSGYLRCEYQQNFDPVVTFDHDLRKIKGLPESARMVVYAPTYRENLGETFSEAMKDLEALHERCAACNLLLIFKVHPNMEKEAGFLYAKEKYGEYPHFWFWDNQDDFYEIMDQMDMAILDYSSILSDMVAVGIKHYIRYVYDYESYMEGGQALDDFENRTTGRICRSFPELLEGLASYDQEDLTEDIERIRQLFWSYSQGPADFERTIQRVMDYKIKEREHPTLYSFDVFDTLISRKVLNPFGIFYYVKERMEEKGGFPASLVRNYPAIRHSAESNVREYYKKSTEERGSLRVEITFDLIFEHMARIYSLDDKQIADLKDWELTGELDNVIPLYDQIHRLKDLLARGEKVVLISDMYLPADFIRKMLEKADPVLAGLPLFVSSEYGVQKVSMDLFFEVYKSFEPFYDFKKWIHYGDNDNGDRKAPRRLGICTRKIEKPEFGSFHQELTDRLATYDSFLVAALQARMCHENSFQRDNFVLNFVSLCMVPYVDWVLRDSMRKGYQTLYFVSRDGYHLKRIADAIIESRNLPIKTKYIYASRRTWRIPSFIKEVDQGFWRPYGNFSGLTSKSKLLRAMDINEETFCRLIPDINLDKINWSNKTEVKPLTEILKLSKGYQDYLLKKAADERPLVSGYLKQEIDETESFAFVEYWGRGFTQDCMVRLWQDITGNKEPVAYYYSRSVEPSVEGSIRYNFTTNDSPQLFVENIFANMPYKTVERYEERDGRICPVIVECDYDKELYESMEELLPRFAKAYAGLNLSMPEDTDRMLYEFVLNYQQEHEDDMVFVSEIGNLADSSSTFGRRREYAPPYTMEDLDGFEAKTRGRRDVSVSSSPIMSVLRSPDEIRDRYMELYQLFPGDKLDSGKVLSKEHQKINKDYRLRYEKLLKEASEFRDRYLYHAGRMDVEDKVSFVTMSGRVKKTSMEPVIKLLEEDARYKIEIMGISKMKDDPDAIAQKLALSRFIILMEPIPLFCQTYFRQETKVILINRNAFPVYNKSLLTSYYQKWKTKYTRLAGWNDINVLQITSRSREKFFVKNYLTKRTADHDLLGCCITDYYYDPAFAKASKERLLEVFPQAAGKKVILYMPYPLKRGDCGEWYNILDMDILSRLLPEDYVVVVNPLEGLNLADSNNSMEIEGFSKIIEKEMDLREVIISADVIVGDYRDTFFEAALLKKPMYSTAYEYENRIKSLNMSANAGDFDSFLFCPLVSSSEELADELLSVESYDFGPMEEFAASMLDGCDGNSSKRVVEYLLNGKDV